ncbi:MAG TPA: DNA topoisomerase [Candidatus Faeciplasma avium]|uniref:DNA topoisomerase (ATP-hydrolyzing) n=1 Tax=Candidatus Faeciplasma avium TaxID=2840798 RepID=A0A9D1NQZ2_9FIRM|nr:DNA topoisomerase [Candidatus Faeciplasma avium]
MSVKTSSNSKNEYGNEAIRSLKGADRVRKRPAVIFGSDGLDGCKHSVFEIISNSVDEAKEGYGSRIIVTRYNDDSIEVEDMGRGCPVDFNRSEGRYNWELVYCELYAGGKYDNASGDNYEYSLGLNGLGACATQYSSEYMDVEVNRDGFTYNLHFEKGENIGGLSKKPSKKGKTGTKTRWRPDLEVFTDIRIDKEYFTDVLKKQSIVNPGICFVLRYQDDDGAFEELEYLYENGILDYVRELVGEDYITEPRLWSCDRKGRDREDMNEYKVKYNFAFAFSKSVKCQEYFHNSSFLEYGGSTERAVRQAFSSYLDSYMKQNGKYLKNEQKLQFVDIEDCLVMVSSSFSTQTSYENQTKKAISNKFIYEAAVEFLKHQLEIYFIENPEDAGRICDQVLVNKRSRESAEKTRVTTKKLYAEKLDMTNMIKKFVDCRTKDVSRRELYIVEGDSALGSVKLARDAEFQAVIPVRGKILNCLKASYNKIFESEIITDLMKVLGCGVEVKSAKNKELSSFNLGSLRWSKIIICTDADYDGFQIRTLILTMLYTLAPTLIQEGFVYIAESPLYEINTRDRTYFAYDEGERAKILSMIGREKYTLQRSKGLGENEPDMMSLTTMNPDTRRLIQVTPDEAEHTKFMFDMLLGDNLSARKEFISNNGHDYIDMADLS